MNTQLIERFFKYVKVDTTSDPDSKTYPSTDIQFNLAHIVKAELEALGLQNVVLDEHCYLTATLPSNVERDVDTIGLVAHFDTSPDFSGVNVNPKIHADYRGDDLQLSEDIIMHVADFPFLKELVGQDIITTDGTTLLGSDDKAGIAEIMTLLEYLVKHPEVEHGTIKVLFTPDEEVGRGTDKVNLDNFQVDYAYTLDGGELGELEYENFNAASLVVHTYGRSIHPGYAKDKLVNAMQIAMDFHSMLPREEVPEKTEHYEGFYHLSRMSGDIEHTTLHYIIRDHDMDEFNKRKAYVEDKVKAIQLKYHTEAITCLIEDSYYNMREKVEPVLYIVDNVEEAMKRVGVKPKIKPIRGGTDGARLSYMGIPTPNICTGGYNFHGRYEMNTVQGMEKTVEILIELVKIITHK